MDTAKKKENSIPPYISILTRIRIGKRITLGMMITIFLLLMPIIMLLSEASRYQELYNKVLDNLGDISYIVQETEVQGYRILDSCLSREDIAASGEAEVIVRMQDRIHDIRLNIGDDPKYEKNREQLLIVGNLLENYAQSYKSGVSKCGDSFSLAGDVDFYAMVSTSDYIVRNCNRLMNLEMQRSEDLKENLSRSFRTMMLMTVVLLAVVVILVIIFSYMLTCSIAIPVNLLRAQMSQITDSGLVDQTLQDSAP